MAEAVHQWTGWQVREAITAGELSCREAAEAFLARVRAVDGKVRAYLDVWDEPAMRRAAELDERLAAGEDIGPLGGVPIALKDVICTREGYTTCASRILEGYRSPFDATVAERLEAAGAVVLGKLNMDEFAMGSSTENSARGATRNPWDLERVPGGSSGGSAAAVAADECAWSLGSDTGGSIRQPAAFCGCVGMKPTYGRVSRYGLVAFASSLDQIGPLTKDTRDLAEALNVICGHDPRDSTSADKPLPDFTGALEGGVKGLRIGLPKQFFPESLDPDMRDAVLRAVTVLDAEGAEIIDINLPHTDYAIAAYYIICTAEASANLARFDGVRYGYRSPEAKDIEAMYRESKSAGFGRETQRRILLGTYALSSGYYDAYYLKAQKVRSLIQGDFEHEFHYCDAIACPTTPGTAFPIGSKVDNPLEMYLADIFTISLNLAGLPGLSIPCGVLEDGMPAGLQLIGKPFDEATLLRAAHVYEARRGFELGRPELP